MSDVITLANQIAAAKEDIRLAIEGRNVNVPADTPFSEYAGKINLIASEVSTGDLYLKDPAYDDTTTSLTLPVKYSLIDYGALAGKVNLQSVNVNNVIYVGDNAFSGDGSLTQFTGNNVKVIGSGAFAGCGFTSFSSSSVETVGNGAFQSCSLTSLSLSKAVRLGINVNSSNSALTSINLPEVTSIGSGAFANCDNLTTLSLPKVEYVGSYCFNSIGSSAGSTFTVSLPELKVLGDNAFYNCTNLRSISMPKVERICANALNHSGSDAGKITQLSVPMCTYIGSEAYRYYSSGDNQVRLDELTIADGCEIHNGGAGEYMPVVVNGKIGRIVCDKYGIGVWPNGVGSGNTSTPSTIDLSGLTSIHWNSDSNMQIMDEYVYVSNGALDFQSLTDMSAENTSGNSFLSGSPYNNNVVKMWLNKNLVISPLDFGNSNFSIVDSSSVHIYTDAASRPSSWPALSNAHWHFNCSHEDFENGIYN